MAPSEKFIIDLVQKFPSIKDEITDDDYTGLFYLQAGILRKYVQTMIDTGDSKEFSRAIIFMSQSIDRYDEKVNNIIYVSIIEHLDFRRNSNFIKLLPPNLKSAYDQLLAYNKQSKRVKL